MSDLLVYAGIFAGSIVASLIAVRVVYWYADRRYPPPDKV